jgi:hypothetical protein
MRRNLFITAIMLQRGGLAADVRLAEGSIEVRLGEHRASFPPANADEAADWLAACAVMNFPESDLAKLWLLLATVAGGAIPFGSR